MINAMVETHGELSAIVIRANGKTEDLGIISQGIMADVLAKIKSNARRKLLALGDKMLNRPMNLVTSAGISALATNFLPSPAIALSSFSWIDVGTGTTAATISDIALQSAAGTARVNGTQSNPTAGSYKVVGTVTFTGSLAITEFGLFSAATTGTMFDHRVFSAINVNNADSIQISYTVSATAGGS